ncbi:hypothetical protein ACOSQ4_018388 [Xanthoceras sorbifolium]
MLKAGTISLSASLLSPNQTHFSLAGPFFTFTSKNALFLSSSQQIQQTNLSLPRRDNEMLSSLCALTLNNKSRKNDTALRETDGSDFDDGMFLPFEEMKRWLENKPRGFGEGKVYDTSIEEKLLQEIEQNHSMNIHKTKTYTNKYYHKFDFFSPTKTQKKKKNQFKENPNRKYCHCVAASKGVPSGFGVHLANLPKKKNIHRDMKSAFEGVPSIINISPPFSYGRFTQIFSKQSISFGKIQKQIKCEMMNSTSSKFVDEHSADSAYNNVELTAPGLEEEPDADSNVDYDTSDSWMETASDGSDPYGELDLAKMEDTRENLEVVSVLELNIRDNKKQDKKSFRDSSSSNQLKVKEKAVLTDVFSKYAVKAALTSKEES